MSLLLHCGANAVARNELKQVALPAATDTFVPIAHNFFVDIVQEIMEEAGYSVVGEAHGLNKKGDKYFGMLEVQGKDKFKDYNTVLGLRNAHNKRFAAALAVGGRVFVCDNMAFSGSVVISHKHTLHVLEHLRERILDAIAAVLAVERHQQVRYDAYKHYKLGDNDAEKLMIDLLRQGILEQRTLPKVVQQWDSPDHKEFKHNNAWKFFNACTESFKGFNPVKLQDTTIALHDTLDDICDVPALELAA